jgi:Zn-dependent protease
MSTELFFQLIVLIFSAIIHEYMHGWMADQLGDPTARLAGRLTLNPIPHLDIFGSFLLPLVLLLSNAGFLFGYAKPVPYNPFNLKDKVFGSAKVALAGPLANIVTAIFFGLLIRLAFLSPQVVAAYPNVIKLLVVVVIINLLLAVFNLLPIPPLDGSKVIAPFLPYGWQMRFAAMDQYGMIIVFLFVMFGFGLLIPVIFWLFQLITGLPPSLFYQM